MISDHELILKNAILELLLAANLNQAPVPATIEPPAPTITVQAQQIETPKPVEYTVVEGDHLTKIGEKNGSSWLRLWQKNLDITDPDVISVGQKIIIPTPEEVLADRPLPVKSFPQPFQSLDEKGQNVVQPRGSSSGNTYTYGYCTWYVKNRRPDLPNNLGNAITWAARAASQGIGTGATPVPGAVGQKGNHVVYVESVSGNMMTISEMNYEGWNIKSSRATSWAGWSFIY